jgi:hypothetical protein
MAPSPLRLTPHCSAQAAGCPRLAGVEWLHTTLCGGSLTAEGPAMRSTVTLQSWLRVPGGFVCRKVSRCVAVSLRLCEPCACLSARGRLVSCASVPAVSFCRPLALSLTENDDSFARHGAAERTFKRPSDIVRACGCTALTKLNSTIVCAYGCVCNHYYNIIT